jgi:hypothetical protein
MHPATMHSILIVFQTACPYERYIDEWVYALFKEMKRTNRKIK